MPSLLNITGHEIALPPVTAALGETLHTTGGERYFDLEAGVWCMSLGHNPQGLGAALGGRRSDLTAAGLLY